MKVHNNTKVATAEKLQITEIRWHSFGEEYNRVKAMCTIVIDNKLVIHEIRVIKGKRLYVEYPQRKDKDSYAHPIDGELGEAWEQTILSAYYKEKKIRSN